MPLGLIALAIGAFGIGLTEFVIAGLLPEIATDFIVSEAAAGWLVSGYALGVTAGAILLTAALTKAPRKRALVALLVLFIVGNGISALAPSYAFLLSGRVLSALCHGAFFGIGSVVAANLVAPARRSSAIAAMFAGHTIANVLGVPFGTFLGQSFGWRSTFWAVTLIGLIALVGIVTMVPKPHVEERPANLAQELLAFRSKQVWLSLGIALFGFGGMFGAFTYMAFTLTGVSGFAPNAVPWLLVDFGVGLFAGNWLGGRAADKARDKSILVSLLALTVVMVAFSLFAGNQAATVVLLFLMAGCGMSILPGIQTRIMEYAPAAPTLAAGASIGTFNIGNALGAWIGGVGISAGLGFGWPLRAGAGISLLAVLVMIVAVVSAKNKTTANGNARSLEADSLERVI